MYLTLALIANNNACLDWDMNLLIVSPIPSGWSQVSFRSLCPPSMSAMTLCQPSWRQRRGEYPPQTSSAKECIHLTGDWHVNLKGDELWPCVAVLLRDLFQGSNRLFVVCRYVADHSHWGTLSSKYLTRGSSYTTTSTWMCKRRVYMYMSDSLVED